MYLIYISLGTSPGANGRFFGKNLVLKIGMRKQPVFCKNRVFQHPHNEAPWNAQLRSHFGLVSLSIGESNPCTLVTTADIYMFCRPLPGAEKEM